MLVSENGKGCKTKYFELMRKSEKFCAPKKVHLFMFEEPSFWGMSHSQTQRASSFQKQKIRFFGGLWGFLEPDQSVFLLYVNSAKNGGTSIHFVVFRL